MPLSLPSSVTLLTSVPQDHVVLRRQYCKHCHGWPWRKALVEFEDANGFHIRLGEAGDVIIIILFYWENELG